MDLIAGIASTTHLDSQGDILAKSALDQMAATIRSRYIPLLRDHDPNQLLGVILYGSVKQTDDGEFALLVIAGFFENEEEAKTYQVGAPNTVADEYVHRLPDILETEASGELKDSGQPASPAHDQTDIASLLDLHLDSTSIWIDGSVYNVKRLVGSTGDLKIHVYRDHAPPHFHVVSTQRGLNARFHLDTIDPLAGSKVTTGDVKRIQDFFARHPEKLDYLRSEHARMQG